MASRQGTSTRWSSGVVNLLIDLKGRLARSRTGWLDRSPTVCYCHGPRGRLRLHAETTSRGSEPVAGPTRSQKTEFKGAQSAEASKGARLSKLSAKPKASKPSKLKSVKQAKGAVRAVPVAVRPVAPKELRQRSLRRPPRHAARHSTKPWRSTRLASAAAAPRLRGRRRQFSRRHPAYPEERELGERARLFLQVCERETARRPSGPQTPSESVYAATVALNAGDGDGALGHLNQALEQAPNSDHAHYIMAVALIDKGDPARAIVHLRQAIALNPG